MRTETGYKTRQRALVEEILQKSGGAHLTADEIVSRLTAQNESVGRTTVYRCLERLTAENRVRKYVTAGESACYQYIGGEKTCEEHFHLKCVQCGRLIHMECSHMNELADHVAAHHGFTVDKTQTVLYGVCAKCSES